MKYFTKQAISNLKVLGAMTSRFNLEKANPLASRLRARTSDQLMRQPRFEKTLNELNKSNKAPQKGGALSLIKKPRYNNELQAQIEDAAYQIPGLKDPSRFKQINPVQLQ